MITTDHMVTILLWASGGLLAALAALWHAHYNFKLHVAEHYVRHVQIDAVWKELRYLRRLSLKIAEAFKVQVPEEYDE